MKPDLEHTEAAARVANLGRKAGRVAEDLKDLGSEALGTVEDAIHEIKALGGEAVENARLTGEDVLEKGRDKVETARVNFEDYVTGHPSKSILIAAAVGALVGFTLRSRL